MSCGYHFAGSGKLPNQISKLKVEIFKNQTMETGLETTITNDIINELSMHEEVVLVNKNEAEAILNGVIKSINLDTISHQESDISLERRVNIIFNINLKNQNNELIWYRNDLSQSETYLVNTDKQTTEQNKRTAIIKLSKRFAEEVYNKLTEDF